MPCYYNAPCTVDTSPQGFSCACDQSPTNSDSEFCTISLHAKQNKDFPVVCTCTSETGIEYETRFAILSQRAALWGRRGQQGSGELRLRGRAGNSARPAQRRCRLPLRRGLRRPHVSSTKPSESEVYIYVCILAVSC